MAAIDILVTISWTVEEIESQCLVLYYVFLDQGIQINPSFIDEIKVKQDVSQIAFIDIQDGGQAMQFIC